MPWTPADDSQARCGPDPGGVAPTENVAKFVCAREWDETAGAISDEALGSDKLQERKNYSDAPGDSDGLSVKRCSHLAVNELKAEQASYCTARKSDSRGVHRAKVSDLRAIRLQDKPTEQVVFVLDDPRIGHKSLPDDKWHAVIRLSVKTRPPLAFVRDQIRGVFKLVA